MTAGILGPPFDPVALGIVKRVRAESTGGGSDLLIEFWDGGGLAVSAQCGEPCTLDVRPAPLSGIAPPAIASGVEHVAAQAREAALAGIMVRAASDREQFEAVLQLAQQSHRDGVAHECSEWRQGFRCVVCGDWIGNRDE